MYYVFCNEIIGDSMARPGITFLDVKDAIAELQGKERNITVDHIREILGTGSRSTINNHLKTWRSQASDAGLNDPTLPSELISLIKGLWENMRNKANDTITQHQTQCDEKMEAIEVKFENTKQALANLEKRNQETSALLQQKTDQADQLQTKLNLEQQETHKLSERIASLETRRQDTVNENKKLHEHIKHLQTNLEHYQATIQKQQQEQSLQLEKLRNESQAKETELVNQVTSLNKTNAVLETSKQQYQQQISHLQKTISSVETEYKACQKQRDQFEVNLTFLQEENNKLSTQLDNALTSLEDEKNQHENVRVKLMAKTELLHEKQLTLVQIGEKLENAEAKIMELANKNNLLEKNDKAKQ